MYINNWIKHPTILEGELVTLIPLEKKHFNELLLISNKKKIWEHYPVDYSKMETFLAAYNSLLPEREKGISYTFVIFHKPTQKLIGSTRFFDIHPSDKKLEIGYTWLHPDCWGTAINFECKLLLLEHCFETLQTIRVQIKTDENNLRSRKAIEKIGGHFEGILRKDKVRENGTIRNTAYYSIIDSEWKCIKQNIIKQFEERKNLDMKSIWK